MCIVTITIIPHLWNPFLSHAALPVYVSKDPASLRYYYSMIAWWSAWDAALIKDGHVYLLEFIQEWLSAFYTCAVV